MKKALRQLFYLYPMKIFNIVICILIGGLTSCSYLPSENNYDSNLLIDENADYIILQTNNSQLDKAGLIFYPGGLVDPHAYIQTFQDLVIEDDRMVILMKAPANLAILNSQKASNLLPEFPSVSEWVIGGHSLGGSVACIDISRNLESFAGLFLLASYSVDDLSELTIPMLSITGSEDQILNQENFNENRVNLPEALTISSPDAIPTNGTLGNTIYYEIEGGNHGQFGSYGEQEGDGTASISTVEQQGIVTETLRIFLQSNML